MSARSGYQPDESIDQRNQVLLHVDARHVYSMAVEELRAIQASLGYGSDLGAWEVPIAWMPAGRGRRPSSRIVRIEAAIADGLSVRSDRAEDAWADILRFGIIRSLAPTRPGRVAAPSTVVFELQMIVRLSKVLTAQDKSGTGILSRITDEVGQATLRSGWAHLRGALVHLYRAGYLPELSLRGQATNGPVPERDRKHQVIVPMRDERVDGYQALPDAFVAECGWRVIWLIRNVGPMLLDCLQRIATLPHPSGKRGTFTGTTYTQGLRKQRTELVRSMSWRPQGEAEFDVIPFDIHLARHIGNRLGDLEFQFVPFAWPPRSYREVLALTRLLQTAHAFVLMLSAGPRSSEVLSLEEDCHDDRVGHPSRAVGRTFKMESAIGGRLRDFPAPAIVVQALKQQSSLSRIVKEIAGGNRGEHLWVQVTAGAGATQGEPLTCLNEPFKAMAKTLGLSPLLLGSAIHTHRFRKTLARLVALSLVNAQMILMDCFGHDDPEGSLTRYILSDRRVHADVIRVQKELVILLATDAINDADTLGGAVGKTVQGAKVSMLRKVGKSALDPADVRELAEALTFEGRSWTVVSPGVICALPLGATGPCAQRQGGRNASECRTGCDHQLLTAYSKTETDETIAYLVDQLELARLDGCDAMVTQWRAQLNQWLYRWRDVFEHWIRHPALAGWVLPWATDESPPNIGQPI